MFLGVQSTPESEAPENVFALFKVSFLTFSACVK